MTSGMRNHRASAVTAWAGYAAVLLAVALVGCKDRSTETAAAEEAGTRDSAGVRIVVSDGDAAVPVWRVAPEPLVEVGGADAGLVSVASALRVKGGFVVADAGTGELRFYDEAGRMLRQAGGKGRGPGEFQYIGWLGMLPGDSLAAWDPLLRRVSVFAPDGRYARGFTPAGVDGFFPGVYGTFADGSLLMSTGMESAGTRPASGAWRDTMVLMRIGRGGEVADTMGRFPGAARYAATGPDGVQRTHSVPFGPTTSAVVHGDEVYVTTGEGYAVAVYGADGRLRRLIRNRGAPIPVTRRERESYAANMLQAGGSAQEQRDRQAMIASAPFPRTMAPVEGLRVDDAGRVWVREAQRPDTWDRFSRWSVFGPEGRRIATVEAPGRFMPARIGPDWVLGRKMDADGTEHVHLYRLDR